MRSEEKAEIWIKTWCWAVSKLKDILTDNNVLFFKASLRPTTQVQNTNAMSLARYVWLKSYLTCNSFLLKNWNQCCNIVRGSPISGAIKAKKNCSVLTVCKQDDFICWLDDQRVCLEVSAAHSFSINPVSCVVIFILSPQHSAQFSTTYSNAVSHRDVCRFQRTDTWRIGRL